MSVLLKLAFRIECLYYSLTEAIRYAQVERQNRIFL